MAGVVNPLPQARRELLVHVGEAIAATAMDVFAATPQGAPATSRVVIGKAHDFCCDAVTVILRGLVPNAQAGLCEPWTMTSEWRLEVSRPCAEAQLGSVYNILPSPSSERASDTLLLLDAVSVYDHFAMLVQKRVTTVVRPPTSSARGCVSFQPGRLDPTEDGDCRGWRFDFRIGLSF